MSTSASIFFNFKFITMKSGGRQYKNVYTILEKVKKGEIQSYYKEEDSLFSRLEFYKKPDLLKPYVHYIDETKIQSIIKSFMYDSSEIKREYDKLKSFIQHKLPVASKIGDKAFHRLLLDNFSKIPEHLYYDIFKMYYHKIEKIEFQDRTDANRMKYKFLEKGNSPVGKIMTEGSNLKSAIFARNIIFYFALQLTKLELQDPKKANDLSKALQDSSKTDDSKFEELMNSMFQSEDAQKDLQNAIDQASSLCKRMDETADQEVQDMLFDNCKESDGANKLSTEFITSAADKMNKVKISMTSLKERIKKLMDKTTSYFSAKKETIVDDLFNADSIAGLEDYIELHPKLRKVMIEDITVKETKSIGKIDLYIDISGSMNSHCVEINGNRISRMEFAKSFALKMKELELLNEVYIFDTRVKKYKQDEFSIAILEGNNGTNINNVIHSIAARGNNAIIITDAEDRCENYSDKAFFIGIKGCKFHYFEEKTLKQYVDNDHIIVFDGSKIMKVDEKGQVIK